MYMYTPHHHSAFDVAEDQTLGRRRRRGETGRRDQWLQSGTVPPSPVLRGPTPARTDGAELRSNVRVGLIRKKLVLKEQNNEIIEAIQDRRLRICFKHQSQQYVTVAARVLLIQLSCSMMC